MPDLWFPLWIFGTLVLWTWPLLLLAAVAFAVYACLRWKGLRWKVAALGPAVGIACVRAFVMTMNAGQLGPGFQVGAAMLPVVLYTAVLAMWRARLT